MCKARSNNSLDASGESVFLNLLGAAKGALIRAAAQLKRYPARKMIRDVLIPALEANFPDRGMRIGEPADPIAVFPAAHPEVGDVTIHDDGNEAIVHVGDITHGHFGWDDPNRTDAEAAQAVTEQLVRFLKDLFADRVLLWKQSGNGAGGWYLLGYNNSSSLMSPDDVT